MDLILVVSREGGWSGILRLSTVVVAFVRTLGTTLKGLVWYVKTESRAMSTPRLGSIVIGPNTSTGRLRLVSLVLGYTNYEQTADLKISPTCEQRMNGRQL